MKGLDGTLALVGGTGAIGARLVEMLALSAPGLRLRVVLRRYASAAAVARYPVELRAADVEAGGPALAAALEGADRVVDLSYPKAPLPPAARERLGARMASQVVAAARAAGVRRLVHFGSISSYGPLRGASHDETAPLRPGRDGYGRAKRAGEEVVLAAARRGEIAALVLQPTVVYGPDTGWSAGSLRRLRRERVVLPAPAAGVCPAVYVDDVCRAAMAALVCDESALGRRFLINGPDAVTWAEFFSAHGAIAGVEEVWTAMAHERIAAGRRQARRAARPFRRLSALLRRDTAVRQALLALPGPAQARWLAARLLGARGFATLKRRLLGERGATGPAARADALPTPVLEALYAYDGTVEAAAARERLGFTPTLTFREGMRLTEGWARWAGLAGEP